jgi:adenylate cyclase
MKFLQYIKKASLQKKELFLSLAITFFVLIIFLIEPRFINLIELKTYDISLQLRKEGKPNKNIAIVAIDEKSLRDPELGRWPWTRSKIAEIIEELNRAGAKVIALDIVFAEPDKTGAEARRGLEKALQKLDSLELGKAQIPEMELNKAVKVLSSIKTRVDFTELELTRLSNLINLPRALNDYRNFLKDSIERSESDDVLANVLSRLNNVVLGYYFNEEQIEKENRADKTELIESSRIRIVSKSGKRPSFKEVPYFEDLIPNIKVISISSQHAGFLNAKPDDDGIYRWGNLISYYNNNFYPSLALKSASIFYDSQIVLHIDDIGVNGVTVGRTFVQTDEGGRVLINFYGGNSMLPESNKIFPYYSATDVLSRNYDKDAFRDKVVFIGATAIGIYDIRPTPYDPMFPGVEIQASILSNILNKDNLVKPKWVKVFDIFVIIIIGVILGNFYTGIRAPMLPIFLLFFTLIYYVLNWSVLNFVGLWLYVVYPTLEIMLVTFGVTIFKYLTEEKGRRQIKQAFQHYLSPNLVQEILKEPDKLQLGGEKKNLTVLFSDIRGFTSISEELPPEKVVTILNEYLTPMTDIVFKNDGLLNKYMGDAIMAIFGTPVFTEKHAFQACETALEMLEELERLNKKWAAENKPTLGIGIGINTGFMHVGNMGSNVLFDYTVIGDSVNLASRLEGINKIYGTSAIISEDTFSAVKEYFTCRELDSVRVKGKVKPVRVYELFSRFGGEKPEWIEMYEEGLVLYRQGKFDRALEFFKKVLNIKKDDHPSKLFIKRCNLLIESGIPEGWDGVFDITQK